MVNLSLFLLMLFITTASEILMVLMYSGVDNSVPESETANYLRRSEHFEIVFGVAFIFETMTSMIAGYLIILYSRNKNVDIHEDPITG